MASLIQLKDSNGNQLFPITKIADSNFLRLVDVSRSITFTQSYTTTDWDISSSIPSGYKPILAFVRATGSYNVFCYQIGLNYSTNRLTLQLRSINNNSITVTPVIYILCMRIS